MRRGVARALAALLMLAGAPSAQADEAPVPASGPVLPFNPVERARKGDKAKYRLVRVAGSTEMPAETYELEVTGRTEDAVHVRDSKGGKFRFARGEKGAAARAFVASYLGEDGAAWVEAASVLDVVADGEAWRVSMRASRIVQDAEGRERPLELALSLWIARDAPPIGVVRASAVTTWGDASTGATLELVKEK